MGPDVAHLVAMEALALRRTCCPRSTNTSPRVPLVQTSDEVQGRRVKPSSPGHSLALAPAPAFLGAPGRATCPLHDQLLHLVLRLGILEVLHLLISCEVEVAVLLNHTGCHPPPRLLRYIQLIAVFFKCPDKQKS